MSIIKGIKNHQKPIRNVFKLNRKNQNLEKDDVICAITCTIFPIITCKSLLTLNYHMLYSIFSFAYNYLNYLKIYTKKFKGWL